VALRLGRWRWRFKALSLEFIRIEFCACASSFEIPRASAGALHFAWFTPCAVINFAQSRRFVCSPLQISRVTAHDKGKNDDAAASHLMWKKWALCIICVDS
jgi:hypothetical protein